MSAPQQASAFNNQIPPRYTIKNITAAYTITGADYGTILNYTGTAAVNFTIAPAASLGAGFNVWILNSTTSFVTLTIVPPTGTLLNGTLSSKKFSASEGTQLVCDGSSFYFQGNKRPIYYSESPISNGNYAFATQQGSLAVGNNAYANANYSNAFGCGSAGSGATTAGAGAIALGNSYSSGTDSFAASVNNNTSSYGAQGTQSISMGQQSQSTASRSLAFGAYSNASANGSVAIGGYSFGPAASAQYSFALNEGSVSSIYGKYAYASGVFSGAGDSQTGSIVLRAATTTTTPVVLTSNNGAASATNQVILPNNSAYTFSILVVARQQAAGGTASAAWQITGLIRQEGTAASTTLVASTVTTISNVPAWTIAVTADTTNGGLAITATGAAATNIRWVATAQTSEVTYA